MVKFIAVIFFSAWILPVKSQDDGLFVIRKPNKHDCIILPPCNEAGRLGRISWQDTGPTTNILILDHMPAEGDTFRLSNPDTGIYGVRLTYFVSQTAFDETYWHGIYHHQPGLTWCYEHNAPCWLEVFPTLNGGNNSMRNADGELVYTYRVYFHKDKLKGK